VLITRYETNRRGNQAATARGASGAGMHNGRYVENCVVARRYGAGTGNVGHKVQTLCYVVVMAAM